MKKVLAVLLVLALANVVILGVYVGRLRSRLGAEEAKAAAEMSKAAKDVAAAKAAEDKALDEKEALSASIEELEAEVERQKASAEAAWESRQELFDELAALEGKLNEELAKLGKKDEEEDKDGADIEGKPFMEVMKAMFTQDFMKTALQMQVPMQLKMEYGKFLDEYVQDPAQRAEAEAIISELLQNQMASLIDAFAAYPDMSKLKSLDANQEATKEMLKAALSTVLDGAQMAAFEERGRGGRGGMEEFGAGIQAQMSGMELNDEEMAAFKRIVREESQDSMDWPPTDADKLDELATMTVGDFINRQLEQAERTAARLAEVLPPEEVEKYRAFAKQQMEMFKMQLRMFTGR